MPAQESRKTKPWHLPFLPVFALRNGRAEESLLEYGNNSSLEMEVSPMNSWNQPVATLLAVVLLSGTVVLATTDRSYGGTLFSDDFEADSVGDILDNATNPIDKWTLHAKTKPFDNPVTIVSDSSDSVNASKTMESNPPDAEAVFVRSTTSFAKPQGLGLIMTSDIRLFADGTGGVSMGVGGVAVGGSLALPLNKYALTLWDNPDADDTIKLSRVDNGTSTDVTSFDAPFAGFDALSWHTYTLRVDFGDSVDTLSAWVDGTSVFSGITTPAVTFDSDLYAQFVTGGGRQARFDNVVIVPEPSVFLLGTMGLVGFLAVGRRRRK